MRWAMSPADRAAANWPACPTAIAQLIVTDLRQGYADAVSWAFIAMAACMGVLVVLGLCYPRDGHRGRDVPVGRDDGSVRSGRGNDDD